MKIEEFDLQICQDNVLDLIDCHQDSELYEEVSRELDALLPEAYTKIRPVALLEFGRTGTGYTDDQGQQDPWALFCLTSLGPEISRWATEAFQSGNYLKGMLIDSCADDYLFQMEHSVAPYIKELCQKEHCGVYKRVEAPSDIDMKVQKTALQYTRGTELAGIQIKESYMYDPVKTTCQVYLLDTDTSHMALDHDCANCPNLTCKMRRPAVPTVTAVQEQKRATFPVPSGQNLLAALKSRGFFLNAACGGAGKCGKCRIKVVSGELTPSREDYGLLSAAELTAGYRLACTAFPQSDCVLELPADTTRTMAVLTDSALDGERGREQLLPGRTYRLGVAVDIGTTTVVMQLIDLDTQQTVDTYTALNQQEVYGADVLSRIKAATEGQLEQQSACIRRQLAGGVAELTRQGRYPLERLTVAGNTTMIHLLMDYDCRTLGVAPFTPVNLQEIVLPGQKLLPGVTADFPVDILPGISTFVGGDIVSGLLALDFDRRDETCVLIDLGTNGEMAIGNREKILVASTAAGPAFEGGNISCGTGSIPGALNGLEITAAGCRRQTIADAPLCGICGSGVIETIYELLTQELVDETGRLDDEHFDDGFVIGRTTDDRVIRFTQQDVREVQLAKSAIRAGLETLVREYGTDYESIDRIYIAGGFGYYLNVEKAIGIGLLPDIERTKIAAVGNTSLAGARLALEAADTAATSRRLEQLRAQAVEVSLSSDKLFNELYMEYMYFE